MAHIAGLLLGLLICAGGLGATPVRADYVAGTILPNHLRQGQLNAEVVDFHEKWKSVYLAAGCGEGRYYVNLAADSRPAAGNSAGQTITVSEAHGYGMLIAAMMAPFDPEAQQVFDGMVAYLRDHPAKADPALMAWNQIEGCDDAIASNGVATATDGDLDIAYALLLADKVWGSNGAVDYRAEARATITAILRVEVSRSGNFMRLGDWAGARGHSFRNTTRGSDFMMAQIKAFADATGEARWLAVRDRSYDIMDEVRGKYAPETGLMPDFIVRASTKPRPAPAHYLESVADGFYAWNACRYPWRVAMDYLIYGEPRALAALIPLNAWARAVTGDDPTKFQAAYRLDGTTTPKSYENPLAFVAPLGPAAMIDPANQDWLNAIWDAVVAKDIADDDYYGNTLKLLSMIVMSGHWPAQ
jgi:endo-1,4-beta-D-glucanase Y